MRILWLSDFDLKGSGYLNLSAPLANGLVEKGHEVKALGLGYRGDEHQHNFSIIPAQNFSEIHAMLQNFWGMWTYDVLITALDIPLQERFLQQMGGRQFKYIGIMPIEADPLVVDWAIVLSQMDKQLIISEFGANEARKVGIEAEHIQIGVDVESWRMPKDEERKKIRETLGYSDEFIVLTVADNQERKNLSRAFEIFAKFSEGKENTRYILVTREFNLVGWKLRSLATEYGIGNKVSIYERGIDFKQLWSLYAIADAFLLPSKAEGLGMPLLEAMAVGVPCVATDCTAMAELLADNRGYLIDPDYVYRDPFGNGRRYLASKEHGADILEMIYANGKPEKLVKNAREYVEERKWRTAVDHLNGVLESF